MKKILLILVCFMVIPASVWAAGETPQRLGKLFLSPAERASLEVIRRNSPSPDKIIAASDIEEDKVDIPAEAVASTPVMVKGYIRRSDGKNTVWVNNQALTEKTATREFAVGALQKNSGQVQVTVNGTEKKTVALKPGQIYDPSSGQTYNHTTDVPKPEVLEEPSSTQHSTATFDLASIKNKIVESFSFLTSPSAPSK